MGILKPYHSNMQLVQYLDSFPYSVGSPIPVDLRGNVMAKSLISLKFPCYGQEIVLFLSTV